MKAGVLLIGLLLVLGSVTQSAAKPIVPQALKDCLTTAVKSLTLPSSANYDSKRNIYNIAADSFYPLAFASVATETEIKAVLKCGRQARVRVVPRNGGHNFEGNSVQNDTIIVDLNLMDKVTISQDRLTATIQGGALLKDVYYQAWTKAQKGFVGGTCPSVGVSGYLLGSGNGFWSRAHGLACDKVVSLKVLTWEGRTLFVNATNTYKDLFWASCGGGGGNFGIVTEWVVKLISVPKTVQKASIKYPVGIEQAVKVWDYFQTWAANSDPKLGMLINYGAGDPSVRIHLYYTGTERTLREVIEESQLIKLGSNAQTFSWATWPNAVIQTIGWGLTGFDELTSDDWDAYRLARKEKNFFLYKPLPADTYRQLFLLLAENPRANAKIYPYGGQVWKRANNATAFPHRRGVLGQMQVQTKWIPYNATDEEICVNWMKKVDQLLNPVINSVMGGYYSNSNYMDVGIENWEEAYYGKNYPRLQRIKAKYDPKNFFSGIQSIQPSVQPTTCTFKPCAPGSVSSTTVESPPVSYNWQG